MHDKPHHAKPPRRQDGPGHAKREQKRRHERCDAIAYVNAKPKCRCIGVRRIERTVSAPHCRPVLKGEELQEGYILEQKYGWQTSNSQFRLGVSVDTLYFAAIGEKSNLAHCNPRIDHLEDSKCSLDPVEDTVCLKV